MILAGNPGGRKLGVKCFHENFQNMKTLPLLLTENRFSSSVDQLRTVNNFPD